MQLDETELADLIAESVKAAVGPLVARVRELESKQAFVPRDGRDGVNGKDAVAMHGKDGANGVGVMDALLTKDGHLVFTLSDGTTRGLGKIVGTDGRDGVNGKDGQSIIGPQGIKGDIGEHGEKGEAGIIGPRGEQGPQGEHGANVDESMMRQAVEVAVTKAVSTIPAPKDGTSVSLADVETLIKSEVSKHVAAIPIPKDGINGKDGVGLIGPQGLAGIGLSGAVVDRSGHLVLTLSDGQTKDIGCVAAKDVDPLEIKRLVVEECAKIPAPKDGRDGVNGKDGESVVGPQGIPGQNGQDGAMGVKGQDGTNGVDGKDAVFDTKAFDAIIARVAGIETKVAALPTDIAPDELAGQFAALLKKELDSIAPPVRLQKRVIYHANGKVDRVVEEPIA